jgi:hypothetical protein
MRWSWIDSSRKREPRTISYPGPDIASLRRCTARLGQKIAKTTPCKVEETPARSTRAALRPGCEKKNAPSSRPNLISSRLAQTVSLHLLQWSHCVSPPRVRVRAGFDFPRPEFEAAFHSRCGGRMSRRNEAKDSATWHVRAHPQSPIMGFDNRPADQQPKPHTTRFRAVESLELALKSRRCEAWTGISHLD